MITHRVQDLCLLHPLPGSSPPSCTHQESERPACSCQSCPRQTVSGPLLLTERTQSLNEKVYNGVQIGVPMKAILQFPILPRGDYSKVSSVLHAATAQIKTRFSKRTVDKLLVPSFLNKSTITQVTLTCSDSGCAALLFTSTAALPRLFWIFRQITATTWTGGGLARILGSNMKRAVCIVTGYIYSVTWEKL